MCRFCESKEKYYVQRMQVCQPILAPITEVEELQSKLINLTGVSFVQVSINYCPMCGRKLGE